MGASFVFVYLLLFGRIFSLSASEVCSFVSPQSFLSNSNFPQHLLGYTLATYTWKDNKASTENYLCTEDENCNILCNPNSPIRKPCCIANTCLCVGVSDKCPDKDKKVFAASYTRSCQPNGDLFYYGHVATREILPEIHLQFFLDVKKPPSESEGQYVVPISSYGRTKVTDSFDYTDIYYSYSSVTEGTFNSNNLDVSFYPPDEEPEPDEKYANASRIMLPKK